MSRNDSRSRISCDGRTLGTGFGVNIRVYDLISNETMEWMSGQEIRREDPRKRKHIAGCMVLEHVHISSRL